MNKLTPNKPMNKLTPNGPAKGQTLNKMFAFAFEIGQGERTFRRMKRGIYSPINLGNKYYVSVIEFRDGQSLVLNVRACVGGWIVFARESLIVTLSAGIVSVVPRST